MFERLEQKKQKELDMISQEVREQKITVEGLIERLEDQKYEWDNSELEDQSFVSQAKMLSNEIHNICAQIDAVQKECHAMEQQMANEDFGEALNDYIDVALEVQQLKGETDTAEQYYEDRHTECMENGDDTQQLLRRSFANKRQMTVHEKQPTEQDEQDDAPQPVAEAQEAE